MSVKRDASGSSRTSIFKPTNSTRPPDALVWSRDLLGRYARLTAVGTNRLLVENHTGLMEVTDTRIRLSTGCGCVTVTGRGLTLSDARRCALIIRGELHRIEFPCTGGDGPQ